MATKLILIRHGQTQWNLRKRYCGFTDIGLNAAGRQQATRLQKKLKSQAIDRVYVSDRERAIQSAKIIFKGRKIIVVPVLREISFGIFEGLSYQQIMKKYGVLYSQWLNKPYSIRPPKGEGLKDLEKRVVKVINKIVSLNKNKTVALVCHGGVISVFLNYILETKDFWAKVTDSASVSIVEYNKNKWKIVLFNDISHLGN